MCIKNKVDLVRAKNIKDKRQRKNVEKYFKSYQENNMDAHQKDVFNVFDGKTRRCKTRSNLSNILLNILTPYVNYIVEEYQWFMV